MTRPEGPVRGPGPWAERRTGAGYREDGAPPRSRVDLDGGLAVIRIPAPGPAPAPVTGGSGT
ncbi:DUF6191 domain-containing protein [Streptomyces sp. NPDC059957]|uniref:DUF6191 domain-containing protein n=1 Tax=Streptomyces sp. NPDC059957 TaxID=3347016 RepID=UPI00364801A3